MLEDISTLIIYCVALEFTPTNGYIISRMLAMYSRDMFNVFEAWAAGTFVYIMHQNNNTVFATTFTVSPVKIWYRF